MLPHFYRYILHRNQYYIVSRRGEWIASKSLRIFRDLLSCKKLIPRAEKVIASSKVLNVHYNANIIILYANMATLISIIYL